MNICIKISLSVVALFLLLSCNEKKGEVNDKNLRYAIETLDSIYSHYSINDCLLLRETYPFDEGHKATYLNNEEQMNQKNPYSYLWPYSGSLSAVIALYESSKEGKYWNLLQTKVLPGLEMYYDTKRQPAAYASYINTASLSDRFYDDNIWIGLDFVDLYSITSDKKYLEKAELIWKFIESGTDTILGGGIYWCEQKKGGKNTCSNAPGSVYALKLYEVTKDSKYLEQGKSLYEWTKNNLQDKADYLYYDNIKLNGRIGKAKYAYNSGQMLQSSVLLYKITRDEKYLIDAQNIAKSCYNQFFNGFQTEGKDSFKSLKRGNVWFTAIMFRGFIELYDVDNNSEYIDAFQKNFDYAWKYMRERNGLFNSDWSGQIKDESKWLLTQFAMVEMYARMSKLKN